MPDDRDKPGQTNNPMAGLMSMMGPQPGQTPAASPPMQQPQAPAGTGAGMAVPQSTSPAPAPSQSMNPIIQSFMGQSQQALSNPMGQAVPQGGGGLIDALKHPLVGAIVKALAQAAQSYGWTAMQPSERLERTQLNQQKAETMGRLAETGASIENINTYREGSLGVQKQRADTAEEKNKILQSHYDTMEDIAQQKTDIEQQKADVDQAFKEGRLDQIDQKIQQQADQFTAKMQQNKDLAMKSMAIRSGANDIRKYYVDTLNQLRTTALQQNNQKIALSAQQGLGKLESTNWLQTAIGGTGPTTMQQGVTNLNLPNIPNAATPVLGGASVPTGGAAAPGGPGASPSQPTPQGKAAAKAKQKAPGSPAGKLGDPLGLFQ